MISGSLKISPWNMTTFPVSEMSVFASVGENNEGGFESAIDEEKSAVDDNRWDWRNSSSQPHLPFSISSME